MSIPNRITIFRIGLQMVNLALLINNHYWISLVVFGLNVALDKVDGMVARKYNQVTVFGQYFDISMDRAINITFFLALAMKLPVFDFWPLVVIVFRDFISSTIKQVAAMEKLFIKGNWWGKAKGGLESVAIVLGTLGLINQLWVVYFRMVFGMAAMAGVVSLYFYISNNWKVLKRTT